MESKHTPGPWGYQSRNFQGAESEFNLYIIGDIHDHDDETSAVGVATVHGNATAGDIPQANARLIAAAPELLAAVRFALVSMCDPSAVDTDPAAARLKQMCEAAIAKAEGG